MKTTKAEQTRREATVTLERPGSSRVRVLRRFTTIRRAERYITECEKRDPAGVWRGDYGIDATERAHYEYQRLRSKRRKYPL